MPLVEARGFSFDLDLFRIEAHGQDEAADPEFAAESDRRRDPGEDIAAHRARWCATAT